MCTIIPNSAHLWQDMSALTFVARYAKNRQKPLKMTYICLIRSIMTKRNHLLLSMPQNSQVCPPLLICVRFDIANYDKDSQTCPKMAYNELMTNVTSAVTSASENVHLRIVLCIVTFAVMSSSAIFTHCLTPRQTCARAGVVILFVG
jgi:hypothetical protein